jgi:hypothetical protein
MRCRREWRKYLVKTSARGGAGAGASIVRLTCWDVRIWVGIASLIVECFYGLGGYGPSSYCTSMPPDVYIHTLPGPNLFDPLNPPLCLYLRLHYAYACPFLAYPACGYAIVDRRSVAAGADCLRPGRSLWGCPRVENTRTDLTPPAAATVSRDRVGLERREVRGSPRGGAVLCVCESGAVRPCFFQTTTVKRPQ